MSLAYKTFPVFRLSPPYDVNDAKIADLRIIFTSADKIDSLPSGVSLDKGETILHAASATALVFLAAHPLLEGVYYNKTIPIASYEDYLVAENSGHVPFYVADAGGVKFLVQTSRDKALFISGSGGYILIDYTKPAWFVGETIEPFNVVFYPDLPEAQASTLTLSDQHGSSCGVSSGTRFTNTPHSAGQTLETAYSFTLTGDALSLVQNTRLDITIVAEGQPTIKSINGVTPVGGNINIQVLN